VKAVSRKPVSRPRGALALQGSNMLVGQLACLAELHSHSRASDGKPTPEEIVVTAAKLGLSAIAVSDHNTFRGSALALRAARDLELDIYPIPANEVRTSRGDVLVLCPSLPDEDPQGA